MKLETIPVEKITSNPSQPREIFDREKLDDLSQSIKTVGIKVPLIVRPKGKQFEIISGQRRWEAAKKAGVTELDAIVKELDDKELAIESLIANEFRENLDPWERAKFLKRIKKMANLKNDTDLGKLVGMTKQTIQTAWTYLDADKQVKEKVNRGLLEARAAREIATIPDKTTQKKVADVAIEQDMSVRETAKLVSIVKKAPETLKTAVLNDKVDFEDAKEVIDTGIPEDMVDDTVRELEKMKEEREIIREHEIETTKDVLEGTLKAKRVSVEPSPNEKKFRRFEKVALQVGSWRPFHFEGIKNKMWRDRAILCIEEIRNSATALLDAIEREVSDA